MALTSSTREIIRYDRVPRHVAVIMDGNGRWAKKRKRPRLFGHAKGLERLEEIVASCPRLGVRELTVFAFSSENWRRPAEEVDFLMGLFSRTIDQKIGALRDNGVRLKIIGSRAKLGEALAKKIEQAETATAGNDLLKLNIAVDYGGRWDILQAVKSLLADGVTNPEDVTEEALQSRLCLGAESEPDLYIRTGGEMRVSNFLLWQMAYTEFYFSPTPWPDFGQEEFARALRSYGTRERRFGRTSEQLPPEEQRPLDE